MKICYTVREVIQRENYYAAVTDGAEIRIWFLTDDILRIRAGFDGDWDEASYSLVMTAWDSRTDELFDGERRRVETAPSRLTDSAEEAVLQGSRLRVVIHKNPFFISVFDRNGELIHEDIPELGYREDSNRRRIHTVRIEDEDHFYGFGEMAGHLDKAQSFLRMSAGDAFGYDAEKTAPLYKHIPFYIRLSGKSGTAVGYFYHNTAECSFDLGKERRNYWHRYASYTADAGDIDLFLIAGPEIRSIISRYTDLTGKSVLLPKAALGYLASSMYYAELPENCDEGIMSFLDTAKAEGFPVDGFHLSSGYCAVDTPAGLKRCSFTWNRQRFKDPALWFSAMEKRGILVSPNVKPGMLLVHPLLEQMKKDKLFVRADPEIDPSSPGYHEGFAVGTWWGGKGLFTDFTSPEARAHWKEYLKDGLLSYGCKSVWNDNCEYDSMTDKDAVVCFEGKGSTIGKLKAVMPNLMCKLSNEAITEYHGDVRPYSVCRSGYAGIQRYAQVWAGDNATGWDTLKYNIATILGMGLSGVANQGCDVGGFCGPAPEAELLVRWVQNGIFQPRFSIHSTNTDNTVTEPWMYSSATELIRPAIRFRYRLSPYFYSLEARAAETGLPIMEALVSAFQNDPAVYREDISFMLGNSLLVANVVEKGQTVRDVYLPKLGSGQEYWYDYETRERFEAGQTIHVPVDLSSIPLFIRSGCIIPFSGTQLMNLAAEKVRDLELLLVPDSNASFTLYEDDGVSNSYRSGCYCKTCIDMTAGEQTAIRFTRSGSYPTDVENVLLDVLHREKAPFTVMLGDRTLEHFLYRKKFEEAEEGWYYSQTKKSVLIKYRNPEKDYTVTISFEKFDLIGM